MVIEPLQQANAEAQFDENTQIAYITYRGLLDASATNAVYDWLGNLIDEIGIENLYGEIFDFREVKEFMPDNLIEARRNSRRYNMRNDVRTLPVAMVISNYYHEEILRGPMQNVEENKRKAIVWNMENAEAFLQGWHASRKEEA